MKTWVLLLTVFVTIVVAVDRPFILIKGSLCYSDKDCVAGSTLCGCDLSSNQCKDCKECGFGNYGQWSADMTCRVKNQYYKDRCKCDGGRCVSCKDPQPPPPFIMPSNAPMTGSAKNRG